MSTLRNIHVAEVSFCRKGMNPHAKVALFKSADTTPLGLAKATFEEALGAQLVSQRVSNAFYGAFDNLWSRNDAFRTAMTDEIEAGGDGSEAADAWLASVKQLADDAIAAARENGGKPTDEELAGAVAKAVDTYLSKQETNEMSITNKAALLAAVAKFNPATDTVAHAAMITKAATDLGAEDALPIEGPLAKAKPDTDNAALVRKVAELSMTADVRKHYDTLAEDAKVAFLAKSDDERTTIVSKANEGDPVLYTTTDGIDIRKSAGDTTLALAKSNDALRAQVADLSKSSTTVTLEKRATEYPNVAKATAISILKTADAMPAGSPERADVIKGLDALNKAQATAFSRFGDTQTAPVQTAGLAKAKGDFDAKVAEVKKRDNIGTADAMSKARQEAPDLFAAAHPAMAEQEAESEAHAEAAAA
jgi:hypothetical protein